MEEKDKTAFQQLKVRAEAYSLACNKALGIPTDGDVSTRLEQALSLMQDKEKLAGLEEIQTDILRAFASRDLMEMDVLAFEKITLSSEENQILSTLNLDQQKVIAKLIGRSLTKLTDTITLFLWADSKAGVLSSAELKKLMAIADKDRILN
jgi:hypothetical protein